jgi:ribosomal protein S18 acetylase RimI-like enzyme
MEFIETGEFAQAQQWAQTRYGLGRFTKIWLPKSHFLYARKYEDGLLFARSDEGIFGYAIGSAPIPGDWQRFSASADQPAPVGFTAKGAWQAHGKELALAPQFSPSPQLDDEAISDFLRNHAPESSVTPGDPEILFWSLLLIDGELAGCAAVCTWQSGEQVLSSVAIGKKWRGQGLGKRLLAQIESDSRRHGLDYLALGVRSDNEAAKALYRGGGYCLLHDFIYYELNEA